MVQVIKRNGQREAFDPDKLRLTFWRAMGGQWNYFMAAHHFSRAIEIYLVRRRLESVSAGALLEMGLMTFKRFDLEAVAVRIEHEHARRREARQRAVLLDGSGRRLPWRRDWLDEQLRRRWAISDQAARVISSSIERETIFQQAELDSEALLDAADERVEQLGLAPWCLMACLPDRESPQQR